MDTVPLRENVSLKSRLIEKNVERLISGFYLFSFSNCICGFQANKDNKDKCSCLGTIGLRTIDLRKFMFLK